jgi:hypothetical protein
LKTVLGCAIVADSAAAGTYAGIYGCRYSGFTTSEAESVIY